MRAFFTWHFRIFFYYQKVNKNRNINQNKYNLPRRCAMKNENSEDTNYLELFSQAGMRILAYFFTVIFVIYAVLIVFMEAWKNTNLFFFTVVLGFFFILYIFLEITAKEKVRKELGLKKKKNKMSLQLRVLLSELIRALLYSLAGYFWLSIMEIVVRQHHFSLETWLIGILMAYGFSTAPDCTHNFIEKYFLDLKPE